MIIQLIDRVEEEKELREKEGQWMYKLGTSTPHGLNDNNGFHAQNKKSRAVTCTHSNIFLVTCA